jgi:hypothetical protein
VRHCGTEHVARPLHRTTAHFVYLIFSASARWSFSLSALPFWSPEMTGARRPTTAEPPSPSVSHLQLTKPPPSYLNQLGERRRSRWCPRFRRSTHRRRAHAAPFPSPASASLTSGPFLSGRARAGANVGHA